MDYLLTFLSGCFYTRNDFSIPCVKIKSLENIGIHLHDLLAGKTHFFIRVGVVTTKGKCLFYGLVNDNGQTGFVRVAKLFVKRADDMLRALD